MIRERSRPEFSKGSNRHKITHTESSLVVLDDVLNVVLCGGLRICVPTCEVLNCFHLPFECGHEELVGCLGIHSVI